MKTKNVGNLFELAERQILNEIKQGKRHIATYSLKFPNKDKTKSKVMLPYSWKDLLKYAIILRKQLDKYGKTGEIQKVKNINTREFIELETKKEVRHRKYLKERR